MSTLLYLASGLYRPHYEDLPFDKVILVDRCFGKSLATLPKNTKVTLIEKDALPAIKQLKEEGGDVKIDCLVSVNEGLFEGGGDYPIFSDFLLGYLSPILSDQIRVITDLQYYGPALIAHHVSRMDWGFKATKIRRGNPLFIEPNQFTYNGDQEGPNYGNVFQLERVRVITPLPINTSIELNIVHGSIWEDEESLDLLGINLSQRTRRPHRKGFDINGFFQALPKILNIYQTSIEEIISFAEAKKIKHLGLTPWMDGDYQPVVDFIQNYRFQYLEKITFYHLRKRDYKVLYNLIN